jgi:hypothetical protein
VFPGGAGRGDLHDRGRLPGVGRPGLLDGAAVLVGLERPPRVLARLLGGLGAEQELLELPRPYLPA